MLSGRPKGFPGSSCLARTVHRLASGRYEGSPTRFEAQVAPAPGGTEYPCRSGAWAAFEKRGNRRLPPKGKTAVGCSLLEDVLLFSGCRCWPTLVDRLGWISSDLKIRAVMVGIATRLVVAVIGHELNHLQRALRAADVG